LRGQYRRFAVEGLVSKKCNCCQQSREGYSEYAGLSNAIAGLLMQLCMTHELLETEVLAIKERFRALDDINTRVVHFCAGNSMSLCKGLESQACLCKRRAKREGIGAA
jgi:hypothetical protein